MDSLKFNVLVLVAIVSAGMVSAPAEDLDAALEAQKKKAPRRVYTDSALLQDRKLTVPKGPSEIEQEADKEFYEAEERLDASSSPGPKPMPRAPMKAPVKDKNWLTPAAMKEEEEDDKLQWTDYSEKATLHDQNFTAPKLSERELIDQMVQERLQPPPEASSLQMTPAEFTPLQQPATLRGTLNRTEQGAGAMPSYMTPADIGRLNLPPGAGLKEQTPKKNGGLNLITPSAAVRESGAIGNPLQFQRTTPSPYGGTAASQEPLDMFNQSTKPLSPLEQIRKSSPIHQRDPFSEDYMPEFKKSIWE